MKVPLPLVTLLAAATTAFGADYTVFRVCEDQYKLRTSDGADAGHVEYVVVDPGEHRIVSTIVTGGILQDRTIAVPFDDFRFGSSHEVTLQSITRERLVSAPVIEQTRISAIRSGKFEPSIVERSRQYFTGNGDVNASHTRTATKGKADDASNRDRSARTSTTATTDAERSTDRTSARSRSAGDRGRAEARGGDDGKNGNDKKDREGADRSSKATKASSDDSDHRKADHEKDQSAKNGASANRDTETSSDHRGSSKSDQERDHNRASTKEKDSTDKDGTSHRNSGDAGKTSTRSKDAQPNGDASDGAKTGGKTDHSDAASKISREDAGSQKSGRSGD